MLAKIRRIGNSQGILLSKTMLEQVDIQEYVNVEVKGNAIVIFPAYTNPREGWEEQFSASGGDQVGGNEENLMGDVSNAFDDSEWTW